MGADDEEGRRPTVYDVARHAGVSIATVSRVLRGSDPVRDRTRDRVLASVSDLGYVPSGSARGLAGGATGVLGLLLPGHDALDEPVVSPEPPAHEVAVVDDTAAERAPSVERYYDAVLRGAEVASWRSGRALLVAAGRGTSEDVVAHDIAGRVDGLVVVASTVAEETLRHVARRVPVVVLADVHPTGPYDHVGVDNREGMRVLVTYAVERHGARDVVHVAGPEDSPDDAERRGGVAVAALEAGLPPVRRVLGDFTVDGGRRAVDEILADGVPDLVVCSNDQMALGVLEGLALRGLRVPQDVLVTGFDGIEAGRLSSPTLTTVHQPMERLGQVAVDVLLQRIADPLLERRSVVLPVEVRLRQSCPPVAAS